MEVSSEGTKNNVQEWRLRAVLALLGGEPAAEVCHQYHFSRSALYKYRQRALVAMRVALTDRPWEPRHPPNRLPANTEERIKALCQRHPTWSSYQVSRAHVPDAPSPRTIQRLRQRLALPRLNKRAPPAFRAHRFTDGEKYLTRSTVEAKLHLGADRLAWDLQNQYGLQISPSTTKRVKRAILATLYPPPALAVWRFYQRHHPHPLWHGDFFEKVTLTDEDRTAYQLTLLDDYSRAYVYCDLLREPTLNDTIRALITAMREYQTIPKGVIFDNGPQFKGALLSAFCANLGIRLIHASVRHPQTNGKLERSFRDDRREYYDQFDEWIFDELRTGLPDYVRYRNEVRGHYALGGKPARTRLEEQNWSALPSVLARLESFARYPLGSTAVELNSGIRVLGRNGDMPNLRYRQQVFLTETLEGLEAQSEEGRVYLLRNYRKFRQVPSWHREKLPFCFNFEEYREGQCPRNAVAL
jgi:transposase InsO family protein